MRAERVMSPWRPRTAWKSWCCETVQYLHRRLISESSRLLILSDDENSPPKSPRHSPFLALFQELTLPEFANAGRLSRDNKLAPLFDRTSHTSDGPHAVSRGLSPRSIVF